MRFKTFMLFAFLLPLIVSAQKKNKKKKETGYTMVSKPEIASENQRPFTVNGASLPTFNAIDASQNMMFDTSLPANKPVILVLFNPSCGHCVESAIKVRENMANFKNCTFLYLTAINQLERIPGFVRDAGIENEKNIIVAADNCDVTSKIFMYNGIPQIMVYNAKHKLQNIFYKEINMDSVAYYMSK
jgi:thiol-disulfide isomerase/thioredoxin